MEEKLRNLSQNIANNTGPREAKEEVDRDFDQSPENDDVSPETQNDEPIDSFENHDSSEESNEDRPYDESMDEDASDYTPEPEGTEEPEPESDNEEDGAVAINFDSPEEPEPEPEPKEESEHQDEDLDEQKEEPSETDTELEEHPAPTEAAILSMHDEGDSEETPARTQKYSPEVEAALSRLPEEESSDEVPEQLSTEPRKKHHAGPIFLFILFVLALAAVSLCILVEQNIIDNPFPNLFKKSEPTSEVQPSEPEIVTNNKYIEIEDWGIKVLKPEGVNGFWYEKVAGKDNEVHIFATDTSYVADTAREDQGANVVLSLIRSTENTMNYSKTITLSPLTSLSGYYYYLVITSGDIEDGIVQIVQDKLIGDSNSILAL